jgi:dipeptidyl aminopeptidase/acylaminoacyl peptidase
VSTLAVRTAALLGLLLVPLSARGELPRTVAEKSDYKATSRHADVVAFCEQLAKESKFVRLGDLGTSSEGRKLPLLIVADPPVATPADAARSGKVVVFAMGNIHAGEVDGKEALLMLARDIATAAERPLLKDLVLVFAPIFNADGNERIDKKNRRSQNGPEDGVGIRANAQGLDLNRDFVKLESPEVRALVRFFNKWDTAVFIDCHTTNGSYHRYTLTYEGSRTPSGTDKLGLFVRDEMLPDVSERLQKRAGFLSYFYGNFSPDRTLWTTVPPTPRYGTHYVGLRHRIAILSESYSYAPFKDRVLASRAFVRCICEYLADNKAKVQAQLAAARPQRSAPVAAGSPPAGFRRRGGGGGAPFAPVVQPAGADAQPKADEVIVLRSKAVPLPRPHRLLGWVEETKDGRRVATDTPKEYEVRYMGGAEPTLTVRRPYAYLVPAAFPRAVETLQRHGIELEELREDIELDVEAYKVDKITETRDFPNLRVQTIDATVRKEARRVPAGTFLVRTAQPLGDLAAYILEAQSADGLGTWHFFDEALGEGKDFPVLRLPAPVALTLGRARPLPEDRTFNKRIPPAGTEDAGPPPNLSGSPVSGLTWLEDGDHFLQVKGGRLLKVHALTGRAQPFLDPAKVAAALAALPTIDKDLAQSLSRQPFFRMNPQRTAFFFNHENDLYYCTFDGSRAVRLTHSPGVKELVSFSPDGRFLAFVRDQNLYVVDVASQTERALTTDGGGLISNGKADWVYFEEVFDRNYQAYWWSPDSRQIAFCRYDDTPVKKFTVIDHLPVRQSVENTPYPKAGDPNPLVKLGIVSAAGGAVRFADLGDYSETASLLLRAGWTPDSQKVYFYMQDRAQTWLDVCTVSAEGGTPTRLFRETTKAWVDDPGPLTFLKDGSFLLTSARTGWNHLYHFDAEGKLKRALTTGEWELIHGPFQAPAVRRVDEANGWAYLVGSRDNPIGGNLYRVRLDGTGLERLTAGPGDHQVQVSPKGNLFLDTWSSHTTPTRVRVQATNGSAGRMVDTNPVYTLEEYHLGKYDLVQIKMADGFVLEGTLMLPPDFDPKRRYPVWLKVYGGPHMPTVHDSWGGGQLQDQSLVSRGFIVFRCDPRSASGKGTWTGWTAYRQLGVQELKDIEGAVHWLIEKHPYVDPARIGISGHSYGGFMTAFALTHSKLFAAGVSGAPVTDWRNYDSIYTERYMNTPQENPKGYDATSIVKAARNLHGRLLLLHGLMDDNVHVQNSVQLVQALQTANKDFDVMFYPRARHGIFGRHYQKLILDFMVRTLKPERGGTVPAAVPAAALGSAR